jgi:integrase
MAATLAVSSHSFRKTVATLIDASGLSARVGADQLCHARASMTQDV